MQSLNPYERFGFNKQAKYQAEQGMRDEELKQQRLEALKSVLNEQEGMGVDQKMLDVSRERLEIEKQILKAARERLQENMTPGNAAAAAGESVEELGSKLENAEKTQATNFEEQKKLEKTSAAVAEAGAKRADIVGLAAENAAMEKNLGGKPTQNTGEGWNWRTGFRPRQRGSNDQIARYEENQAKIAQAGGEGVDFSGYDDLRDSAQTDLGKLQAERAKRQAMLNEKGRAAGDYATLVAQGAPEDAISAAKSRMDSINQQLGDLADLKTGQRLGFDQDGNAIGVRGDTLQGMDTEIKSATDNADANRIRQELEAAKIRKQGADEALAQEKAMIEAGQRRLEAEEQISALKMAGADGAAAQAEFNESNAGLQKRLKAVKDLEAAEAKFRASKKESTDVDELNAARVRAMEQGYQQGDSSQSVQLEVAQAKQILEIKKQIAETERAAAEFRRNEIMQELRMQQQLMQLRINEARGLKGEEAGPSEREIMRGERARKSQNLQKALPLLDQRESLVKKAESGGELSSSEAKKLADLNKQLAELGVGAGQNRRDIEIQIKAIGMEEAEQLIRDVEGRKRAASDMQIDMQRTIEQYGFGDQAFNARQSRLNLQQQATTDQKYQEFKDAGFEPEDAKGLAEIEAMRERLADEIAYEGKPRVDSLTAVGGGAGFVGLVPGQDKMDRLAQLAEQQKAILEKIAQQNDAALQTAQNEINKNNF
jgi:hypothetical protein